MRIHQRTLIRKYVVTALMGNTDARESVFPNRVDPLFSEELPAICVYTLNDDPTIENEAPLSLKRSLDLMIDITVERSKDADDLLDCLCNQVELIMSQDDSLGGTCMMCLLGKTEITESAEGTKNVLRAKISLDVTYRSYWPDEIVGPSELTTFAGIDTTSISPNIGDGSPEIDSTINLPS